MSRACGWPVIFYRRLDGQTSIMHRWRLDFKFDKSRIRWIIAKAFAVKATKQLLRPYQNQFRQRNPTPFTRSAPIQLHFDTSENPSVNLKFSYQQSDTYRAKLRRPWWAQQIWKQEKKSIHMMRFSDRTLRTKIKWCIDNKLCRPNFTNQHQRTHRH